MFYNLTKRSIDLVSVILLSLIFSPFLLILPFLIKLQSPGPVFFKHRRVGRNGREFYMYKFRSMYKDADKKLLHNKKFWDKFKNERGGWKIPADEDPRITPIGLFMRKFTLDEFPQLINVLQGEMSLVGPRPYRKDEIGDEIEEQLSRYPQLKKEIKVLLSAKPGITGPWQTSGRNNISWDQQVKLGADYARRRSILYDLKILIKTPFAMLSKW